MYFSLPVERKVPKERHVREGQPPLRNPPSSARLLRHGRAKEAECAQGSGTPDTPHERRSAVRADLAPNAEKKEKTPLTSPRTGEIPRARHSAEVADLRLSVK